MNQRFTWSARTILLAVFFLSGASSLVYQILWVRLLSLTVGSTVYAISLVVSAFMAGLALGSAWLGRAADHRHHPLRLYAWMELGIGLTAIMIPFGFTFIARSVAAGGAFASPVFGFVASFLLLLVPTTLMGGTLPVLSRYVADIWASRGASIGILYSANTIGAIAGTAVTGLFLIRAIGIRNAMLVAAAVNGLIFFVSLALASRWPTPTRDSREPAAGGEEGPTPEGDDDPSLLGPVTAVYAVNGFAGLALEVLWTRAIMLYSTNTIYAFTIILTTFLIGIALGSSVMSATIRRVAHPAVFLGVVQCALALIVTATIWLLGAAGVGIFNWADSIAEPFGGAAELVSGYAIALVFMLPATVLMGVSFPLVAEIVARRSRRVGGAVGRVYALNTVGAVLGSLLAGFVLIPAFGLQRAILVQAMVAAGAGSFLLARARAPRALGTGLVALAAAAGTFAVAPNVYRSMLSERLGSEFVFYEEGVETTVAVYDSERAKRPVLVINNSVLDDRGVVHKLLAHLPMSIHPNPRRALVLGFGVGISSASLAAYGIAENHCVEIAESVIDAAPEFASVNAHIAGRGDESFEVFIEDGRRFLLANPEPYDVIILDANSGNLRNAGVGKLYTKEFFSLCRDRLSEDGWVTLYASPNGTSREFDLVVNTFLEVFPEATLWVDRVYGQTCVLLGGKQALEIDVTRMLERTAQPAVAKDLEEFDLDQPGALLGCFVTGPKLLRQWAQGGDVNTDDHPVMEFHDLGMSRFEADDRPHSDPGFGLYRQSVRSFLTTGGDRGALERVEPMLRGSELTMPLVLDAWVRAWNGNAEEMRSSLQFALTMFPELEHLRTRLGIGREALRGAAAIATADTASAAALATAGFIALRRDESESAVTFLKRAAGRPEVGDDPARHAQVYQGLGRAYLKLARSSEAAALVPDYFRRVEEHLDRADELGADVTVDRLELEIASRGGDDAPSELLRRLGDECLRRFEFDKSLRAFHTLISRGVDDTEIRLPAARIAEALGDHAEAFDHYRTILRTDPENVEAQVGAQRTGIEIAIRRDVFRRAFGNLSNDPEARTTLLTRRVVSSEGIPAVDHTRPEPWLQLADSYLRGQRPFVAYLKARAARAFAPNDPMPYIAIGRIAERVKNAEVAELAFEAARELGASRATSPITGRGNGG